MNIILNQKHASFQLSCPWENPANSTKKYAKAKIHQTTKKRTRHIGSSSQSCILKVSVWSPSRARDTGPTGKSFQRTNVYETVIKDGYGDATILAVSDAFETRSMLRFTWIAIAIQNTVQDSSVFILRLTENEATFYGSHRFQTPPKDLVILRGPTLLVQLEKSVQLMQFNSPWSSANVIDISEVTSQFDIHHLCRKEYDARALALVSSKQAIEDNQFRLAEISNDGKLIIPSFAPIVLPEVPTIMIESAQNGMLILGVSSCVLRAMEIRSGNIIWETKSVPELENFSYLSVFEHMVLISRSSSSEIWQTPLYGLKDKAKKRLTPELLFRDPCESISSSNHEHFYAPWREFILQVNDEMGTCCTDKKRTVPTERTLGFQSEGTKPFVRIISRLEKRVRDGIERLIDEAERREDKEKMLENLCTVLSSLDDVGVAIPRRKVFNNELNNIALSLHRDPDKAERESTEKINEQDHKAEENGDNFGDTETLEQTRFVRLIDSKCYVNYTGQFIEITARVKVLPPEPSDMEDESKPFSIRLSVQIDQRCPMLWDVNIVKGLRGDEEAWLGAFCPTETIIAHCRSLSEHRITVSVKSDRNQTQVLFSRYLSSIITNKAPIPKSSDQEKKLTPPYQQNVYIIAEGPCAHHLNRDVVRAQIGCEMSVMTTEHLAYIILTVTSKLQLVMAISQLRAASDDRIKWRLAPKLSQASLSPIDDALLSMNREIDKTRTVTNQIGKKHISNEIKQLFASQCETDTAFGRLEEMLLSIL